MIRISCERQELLDKISAHRRSWSEWGQIKPVYVEIQRQKCGYCETFTGGAQDSQTGKRHSFTHDVEHFRPKKAAAVFHVPSSWSDFPGCVNGPAREYPWLALEPWNYVAACGTCNKTYKKSLFPIAERRAYSEKELPWELEDERPYLIYPLGTLDNDPEELISFVGPQAIPHPIQPVGSHAYWRAKVTIKVLGLNNDVLFRERNTEIVKIAIAWGLLLRHTAMPAPILFGQFTRPQAIHSSCCRNFLALCQTNPPAARDLALEAARSLSEPLSIQMIEENWRQL